jgi:uncharacterized protein (TIGR02145 family)
MKKTMFLLVGTVFALMSSCRKDSGTNIPDINFNPSIAYGSMTDQDGNIYKTVKIGTQIWLAENLRTTKYRNGMPITEVSDAARWEGLSSGAYCKYNNDPAYEKVYGCLYNWFAVYDGRNIAPAGWHVPTLDEYNTLVTYLGGWEGGIAELLMEAGEAHWNCPGNINTGATNESGFTALPGGERYFYYEYILDKMSSPVYMSLSCVGCWWTTTSNYSSPGYSCTGCVVGFMLSYTTDNASFVLCNKGQGHSVRCVKD